jgi:hypothetical protein
MRERREQRRTRPEDEEEDENEDDLGRGYTDPPGGRNVVTNTILPRFFARKVVTKGRNIFARSRNVSE